MTIDPAYAAYVEGFVAGLGWGLLVGGVLGARWLWALATETGKP